MTDITAYDARLGISSGRIDPTTSQPIEGTYVLVLGDENARTVTISGDDFGEVVQKVTVPSSTRLIRLGALLRSSTTPFGHSWRFSVLRDDVERVGIDLPRKVKSRSLSDIAIPIDPAGETFDLALRLTVTGTEDTAIAMPAIFVDELIDDQSTNLVLINRNPEPDETDVPIDGPVVIEIHNPDSATIDTSSITVYVGGILAVSNGAAQAGFGVSIDSLDGGRTAFVTITPDDDLESLVTYETVVRAAVSGGPHAEVIGTYSFTTEDLIPPELVSVLVLSHTTIRVTFSEEMTAEDADGARDVLNLTRWTAYLLSTTLDDGLPAVPLVVTAIAPVVGDPLSYDITFDWEMTPGALYQITVETVNDLAGNLMEGGSADFTGYACPAPDRRRFTLPDMLPELNRREDRPEHGGTRDLEKLVKSWQEIVDLLLCDIDRWTEILDPDIAPESFVDAMLADLGNPFNFSLSLVEKRKLVRSLVAMYQKKGTADGIKDIVRFFLGLEVEVVVPWKDGIWVLGVDRLDLTTKLGSNDRALRYSFYITCDEFLTDEQVAVITEIAEYVRASHEHLLGVFGLTEPQDVDHWQLNLSHLDVETVLHA